MNNIESAFGRNKKRLELLTSQVKNGEASLHDHGYMISSMFFQTALYYVSIKDYNKTRQYFNLAAKTDIYRCKKYNSDLLSIGINNILVSLLSDNLKVIEVFANLEYKSNGLIQGFQTNVNAGKSDIWTNTVQLLLKSDFDKVEHNLDIIEKITLPNLTPNEELLRLDYAFFKSLLKREENKCNEIIKELVKPKNHKTRNENKLMREIISFPGVGYAKLARIMDINIHVSTKLIPDKLIELDPISIYDCSYNGLNLDID